MKKLFAVLAASAALTLSVGLAACSSKKDSGGNNGKFGELNTTQSVYGFSAASAGMLVSSMKGGSSAQLAAAKSAPYARSASAFAEGENVNTEELNRYMALVESLLSDGNFNFVTENSDREGYETKMVVSYLDLQGNTLSYVMHYNQILTDSETDGNGYEENYAIEGVMVIDGADYQMRGESKNEKDDDESESKTRLEVTLDATRRINVEQNYEAEDDEAEQEYSYSLFDNNTLVERSTFSYETEQDETELKMTTLKDGKTQVLYFEKEIENGETVIEIHIGDGIGGNGYVVNIVQDENGGARYEYTPTNFDD